MRVVVSLAWARLRHRPARWLLVAFGVAAAAVLPVVTQAVTTVVQGQALRYGLEELPPGDRSVAVIRWTNVLPPADIAALDASARESLASLTSGAILGQMQTHAISDGSGGVYRFAAVDDLLTAVRITEGRAPASCTPSRCEVVRLGPGDAAPPPQVGLVVVGRAVRVDPLLLAGTFDAGDGSAVLVADGVAAAAQVSYLEQFSRAYAWVGPVDLDRVRALGVDAYLTRSAEASLALTRSGLALTAPDQQLRDEADRAARSTRRFALLGGAATALLLGFCVIGAIGARRDHAATAGLLRRRGARLVHLVLLAAIAGTVPVVVGAGVGLVLGGAGAAIVARLSGAEMTSTAIEAVRLSLPVVGLGALAAAAVVVATLLVFSGTGTTAGRGAWRTVDTIVAAGAVTVALALARGAVTVESLGSGVDPLLLTLPVVAVVCGGLLVGRVWPPVTAALARVVPRRLLAPRLGLVGAVRAPLRPVATAAFLAAAVAVLTFAGAYQGTLRQGAADQAAFVAPLDATVRMGPSLRPPLDVAGLEQYRAAGLNPYPVVRSTGTVRLSASQAIAPDLVGVDPGALPLVHGWSNLVGDGDAATAARAIATSTPQVGRPVPAGATTLRLAVAGTVSDLDGQANIEVAAWLRLPDGRDMPVRLGIDPAASPDGPDVRVRVGGLATPAPPGTRLFAVSLTESQFHLTRRVHHEGEGGTALPALAGTFSFGPPVFDVTGSDVDGDGVDWSGWGSDDASVSAAAELTVGYSIAGQRVLVRAGHGPEPELPVLVDPETAASAIDGVLSISLSSGPPIAARVAAVLPRFPDVGPRFVVADARALAERLDAREPGTGSAGELWLAATPGTDVVTALSRPPFDLLRVQVRESMRERLAADPVARGASDLLTAGASLAFAVALLALALLVLAERRDTSAELYAWESDGVSPATLRRSLFLRAVAVVVVAVPGGILVGLALSRITVAMVRVTAVGSTPVPPLATAVTPLWTVLALAGGVGAGLVACGALAAAALRERLPRRPEEAS